MTNFQDTGYLGGNPERKDVKVKDESRSVVSFRIKVDRPVRTGDGYEDRGGFWADVDVWSPSLQDRLMNVLEKGVKVFVSGTLTLREYQDRESGQTRSSLKITADYVAIDTIGLGSITRATRSDEVEPELDDRELALAG